MGTWMDRDDVRALFALREGFLGDEDDLRGFAVRFVLRGEVDPDERPEDDEDEE